MRMPIKNSANKFITSFALTAGLLFGMHGLTEAATDATTVGEVAAVAGKDYISVRAAYTNDDNSSNSIKVEYRIAPGGNWTVVSDTGTHSASPYRTPISGLTEGVKYDVRVTFNDAEGLVGKNPVIIYGLIPSKIMHNSVNLNSTKWGGSWGVDGGKYGEFTCGTCHTPRATNIKGITGQVTAPTGTFPGQGQTIGFKSTKEGSSDFGDDSGNRATSSKICEICHTYDASRANGVKWHAFSMASSTAELTHNNKTDCTITCHKHNVGFKGAGDCSACHGATPADYWKTDLVNGTPGNAPGAHAKHYDSTLWPSVTYEDANLTTASNYIYQCGKCHEPYSTMSNPLNPNITLSSTNNPPSQGGTYASGGCSNLYCHGNFTGGTVANTPNWGNSTSGACGTCHGASTATPPSGGSHMAHVGSSNGLQLDCSKCHKDTAATGFALSNDKTFHVNYATDWKLDAGDTRIGSGTYNGSNSGTKAQLTSTYGQCSNIYCHSNAQTSPPGSPLTYATPTWGNAAAGACGTCHGGDTDPSKIASGSHTKHVTSTTYNYNCNSCHNGYGANTQYHADKLIQVAMSSGTYTGSQTTGDSYGGCSSVACHSDGVSSGTTYANPQWGASSTGACGTCHGVTAAKTPASTRHAKHVGTAAGAGYKYACYECHSTVVNTTTDSTYIPTIPSSGYALHVNGTKNVAWNNATNSAGSAYVSGQNCTNLYCHSKGTSSSSSTPYQTVTWATTSLDCTGCHGGTASTNTMISTGSHTSHLSAPYSIACTKCHTATVSNSTTIGDFTKHVNKAVNIAFDAASSSYGTVTYASSATPTAKTPGTAMGQCSNVYCHGSGNTTPLWGSGTKLDCGGCHNASKVSSTMLAGAHQYHYSTSTVATANTASNLSTAADYIFNCGVCHGNNSHMTGTAGANRAAEVNFDSTLVGSATYTPGGSLAGTDKGFQWTAGTCSTTYCHNDGNNGAPKTTSFTWSSGTGSLGCTGCHGSTVATNTMITSGSHTAHITTGMMTPKTCDTCHVLTVTSAGTITNKSLHVNKVKDVSIILAYDSDSTSTNNYNNPSANKCSSVYCHSTGQGTYTSPTWGSAATGNCGTCHGVDYNNAPASAKHQKHVASISGAAYKYDCYECHSGVVNSTTDSTYVPTISTPSSHVNKSVDVAWSTTTNSSGSTYVSGGNCTNLYCHSKGTSSLTSTPNTTVSWSSTLSTDCTGCHNGATASNTMSTYAHLKHVGTPNNYGCSICHNVTVTNNTTIGNFTKHVNKLVDIEFASTYKIGGTAQYAGSTTPASKTPGSATGTCSTVYCHGSTSPTWSTVGPLLCDACHSASNASPTALAGAHMQHYTTGTLATSITATNKSTTADYLFGCGVCHPSTQHSMGKVNSYQTASVAFDSAIVGSGTYSGQSSTYGVDRGFNWTAGACSNIYCHSKGDSTSTYSAPYYTGFNWGTADGTLGCTGCHGFTAATNTMITSGSHTAHIMTGAMTPKTCDTCHVLTTTTGTSITDRSKHVNKVKDVGILALYDSNGNPSDNYASSKCSSVYCHSNGKNTYTSPTWGSAATGNCGTCHGVDYNNQPALSGRHSSHVGSASGAAYKFDCYECHSTVVNATADSTSVPTITSNPVSHVNGTATVVWNSATNSVGSTYVSGQNCTNLYCHSKGTSSVSSTPYQTVNWSTSPLDCTGCHGGTVSTNTVISTGSHTSHLSAPYSIACTRCHTETVSNSTTIGDFTKHVNKAVNIAFDAAAKSYGTVTYLSSATPTAKVPGTTMGKCSNVYCHGAGNTTPTWGSGVNLDCSGCHSASNASGTALAGAHMQHYTTGKVATSITATNNSTTADYIFGCGVCHPTTVSSHMSGTVTKYQTAEVSFDATIVGSSATYSSASSTAGIDRGFNWTGGSCSNVYCHSKGDSTYSAPLTTNFTWSTADGTLGCTGCHGFTAATNTMITSGSHTAHITTGLMAPKGCETCHVVTTSTGTTITDRSKHVNKTKDVGILSMYDSDTTPTNNYASQTCSSVYCHSTGQGSTSLSSTPTYTTPVWGSAATGNCGTCHMVAGSTGTISTGSHAVHVNTGGATCGACHTGATLTSYNTPTLHINKLIDVSFSSGTYTYGGSPGNGYGACATTSCHGSSSPIWGANTANDTCTKCHGTPTAGVTADTRYLIAPPKSLAGLTGTLTGTGKVSDDPKVGAHQTHLQLFNGLTGTTFETVDQRCQHCHGSTLPTTGSHANGSAAPVWDLFSTKSGSMTPSYNSGTGACSNTYCHNPAGTGGTLNTLNSGLATTPTWTQAGYIADGTLKTQTNCNRCHKIPDDAGFTSTTDHTTYTIALSTDCSTCHGHNGEWSGATGKRHIDGIKYGGGDCDSCHDYDAVGATYAGGVWSGGAWGKSSKDGLTPNEGFGAHAKHINHIKTRLSIASTLSATNQNYGATGTYPEKVCGTCHTNVPGNHISGGRMINFGDGTYKMGGSTGFDFKFVTSPTPTYNGQSGVSSLTKPKTCSNISCHFQTTPVWSPY